MVATLVEVMDDFRLMFARANSPKGTRIPDAIRIQRPHEPKQGPIGWSQFGRMLKGG